MCVRARVCVCVCVCGGNKLINEEVAEKETW